MNAIVRKWEGLRLVAYYDTGKVPTIGYGHTKGIKHSDVGKLKIDVATAERWLEEDLLFCEKYVMRNFPGLSANRSMAVVSFIFNLGPDALFGKTTKIAKYIKAKNWQMVAAGMLHYIKDDGVVLNGLINRRVEEASYIIRG